MVALDGSVLDCAVHPLDLVIGPRVVRLGQPVVDTMLTADLIEAMNAVYANADKRGRIAEMATIVMDHLLDERRYQEAIDVADAILVVPRDAYTMVKKGSARACLLRAEFIDKYSNPALIPSALRPRYQMLAAANAKAFKEAETLAWELEK